ncbi:MAG: decarboxylating 6-phosphogluconate dehydrogenase [Pseudomonadota bacterium]
MRDEKERKGMRIALIGLGRMGMNMTRRLLQGGHQVVVYNRSQDKVEQIEKEGAIGTVSLSELVTKLAPPRIVWMMLPAGQAIDQNIEGLTPFLSPGDILVDGGNTYYKDDLRRADQLSSQGIHYLDAGVSGGIWGLKKGYCLMIGGPQEAYQTLVPILSTLAPEEGYAHCGPSGAGHFVKMVHNGIEYGMMAAYGEGFSLLNASPYKESLEFSKIAHLWNQGSVIRSWLLELLEEAFQGDPKLTRIKGYVEDSGEGRWTVQQAIESAVSIPVITLSLMQRFRSREIDSISDKVLAILRQEFGGHTVISSPRERE